jgi:hypothetical protein
MHKYVFISQGGTSFSRTSRLRPNGGDNSEVYHWGDKTHAVGSDGVATIVFLLGFHSWESFIKAYRNVVDSRRLCGPRRDNCQWSRTNGKVRVSFKVCVISHVPGERAFAEVNAIIESDKESVGITTYNFVQSETYELATRCNLQFPYNHGPLIDVNRH